MEKKKRGEREWGKKREKEKKGNGDKNIYGTAKNFPIVSGQRASRTAAIQSFRRTCSLRMTIPPVSCARQMQRTIWLDVCARSRSVLISVLLCPRSGITRAGERVSRRSVVIPRSSEGLQRGLLAKLICNAVTRDRRIHSNAAFPLFNFPYHLWNFPRPIFLHHPLRFTFFHHRFSRNFYPGTSTALAKSLCVLDRGELRIFDIRWKI